MRKKGTVKMIIDDLKADATQPQNQRMSKFTSPLTAYKYFAITQ